MLGPPMAASRPRRGSGGRPAREAATPSALAPALLRWATTRSVDATLLANRAGLEGTDGQKDDAPITSTSLAAMIDLAAEISAEPHLGLRLPSELEFRRFDAGAIAARVAATPSDVLGAIQRFAALVFPRLEISVTASGATRFEAKISGAPRGLGHHVDEYLLAFALGHCRRGGANVVPRSVWLMSARPPGDLSPLVRALGTEEIELGRESTGFILDVETASTKLPAFDPMLVAAAEHLATAALATAPRAGALASAVAARIETMLPGEVTADTVAAVMKMSARTLQRRLEDEGVRFSAVLDEVRERIAKRSLADPSLGLAEIAYRIGFSDLAAFSRAFKRWTGVPPGAYRRSVARA
jgi:AraC-like DNA-binding protein